LSGISIDQSQTLMVRRRPCAVANHEATMGPSSFETPLRGSSSNNGVAVMQG
jgi:hypothetical protein